MKNLRRYGLLTLVAILTSCSSDDGPPANNMDDAIIGTWQLIELNVSPPQDIDQDGTANANILTELDCVSGTLNFSADNTWDLTFEGVNITFITGDLYNISCSSFTNRTSGVWQLQNTQLTLFQAGTPIFYTLGENRITNTIGEDLPLFRSEVYEKQ